MVTSGAKKLKDWRVEQKLTLRAVAEQIGATATAVHRYEQGHRIPDRLTMPKLVTVTGGAVQPGDFYAPAPIEAAA